MLDVDAFRVDAERRGRAFEEAVRAVGPPDGSIVLKVRAKQMQEVLFVFLINVNGLFLNLKS